MTDNPRTDSKPETILVRHNDDTSVKTSLDSPMSLPSGPTDPWLLFGYRLLVVRSSSFHSTCHLQQHPDPLAILDLCLHSQLILKPRHVILVIFDHHLEFLSLRASTTTAYVKWIPRPVYSQYVFSCHRTLLST